MDKLIEYIEKLEKQYKLKIFFTNYTQNALTGEILPDWLQDKIKECCKNKKLLQLLDIKNIKQAVIQSHIAISKNIKLKDDLTKYIIVKKSVNKPFEEIYCIMPFTNKNGSIVIIDNVLPQVSDDNDGFARVCKMIYHTVNEFIKFNFGT